MSKSVNINLKNCAVLYMAIPVLIFFIGFLKWYFALGVSILFLIAVVKMMSKKSDLDGKLKIKIKLSFVIVIVAIALIWCWLAGIGGFFYQTSDHAYRNAVFRDLIFYDFPVKYNNIDATLVYYIAIWMVPSVVGKLFSAIGCSATVVWYVARVTLLIWCIIGVAIVFLLIFRTLRVKSLRGVTAAVMMFVLFSGMDIVGFLIFGGNIVHLETWSHFTYQLSSISTCLFWVYNQAIVPWIVILIINLDRQTYNMAFYGLLALPYSPLPLIGIVIYCFVMAFSKHDKLAIVLKKAFSLQNVLSILSVGAVYITYYMSNRIVGDSSTKGLKSFITFTAFNLNGKISSNDLLVFWIVLILIEIVPFGLYTWKSNKKDSVFITTLLSLAFLEVFKFGEAFDFGMRATIPAQVMLFLYVAKELKSRHQKSKTLGNKKQKTTSLISYICIVMVLTLGMLTPFTEIARGVKYCSIDHTIFDEDDSIPTLDNPDVVSRNFTSTSYENSLFFKYIAK